ncbi:TPA: hypothetical protein ACXIGC_000162 [Stenotrophomonas maltophilia]
MKLDELAAVIDEAMVVQACDPNVAVFTMVLDVLLNEILVVPFALDRTGNYAIDVTAGALCAASRGSVFLVRSRFHMVE